MKTETDGQKMLRFSGNRYGENANQFILVIRRMSAQIKKSFYTETLLNVGSVI